MNESMCRVQRGSFVYYTCRRIPVRHAFTTKFGGVSTGACESLNLGFNRGDELEECARKLSPAGRDAAAWMRRA